MVVVVRREPSVPCPRRITRRTPFSLTVESTDYGVTSDLPAGRMQARYAAAVAVTDKYLARNVKQVFIGNSMYPTEANARRIGLTKDELSAIFQAGLAVDYAALQKTAAAAKGKLAGKEITIISPHGTRLTVGVEPNAAFANDGVISDDKVKAGGAAVMVYLPAGEAYTRTKPGTANGKVVVPSLVYESEPISDLMLTFEKGKLTTMTAKPGKGFDRLQANYKAATDGKDQLSIIDLGVNPAVRFPKAARDVPYPAAGVVTVCLGNDSWANGTNKSSFGLPAVLRDATLTVDGKVVVKDGELVK